jgi:hypothetical protein
MEPLFMIKYGKKEHLEQLVTGSARFAPSQTYIKIEETQRNKGQGDLLEGKMRIKFEKVQLFDPDTKELLCTISNQTLLLSIQDVNNMPVFCLSIYDYSDTIEYLYKKEYSIAINKEKLNKITTDFPNADYALIILEPDKFIKDIVNIPEYNVVSDEIKYFDYDINTLQMYMFLTGQTRAQSGSYSLDYNNRYRHLLCKDINFAHQQEFRFIITDEKITAPKFYNIKFTSKYILVPISELSNGVLIKV